MSSKLASKLWTFNLCHNTQLKFTKQDSWYTKSHILTSSSTRIFSESLKEFDWSTPVDKHLGMQPGVAITISGGPANAARWKHFYQPDRS